LTLNTGEPLLVLVTGLPGTGKSTVAEAISTHLRAPVLSHDWAMSGLRRYPEIQAALDSMEPIGHRVVGWSILNALARSHLRQGGNAILDGVARSVQIDECDAVARGEGARFVLVTTRCSDRALHRSRIEGRQRLIPNWYEVDWSRVERSLETWEEPEQVDLGLDSADDWQACAARIDSLFVKTD
jgi:hypothetical protein